MRALVLVLALAACGSRPESHPYYAIDGDETHSILAEQLDGAATECNAIAAAIRALKDPSR